MKRRTYSHICKICKRKCCYLGRHTKKYHKIILKKYYDIFLKRKKEGKCLVCSKRTKFLGVTRGYRLYCTIECALKNKYGPTWKQMKAKLKKYGNINNYEKGMETRIRRYGVKHILQIPKIQRRQKKKERKTREKRGSWVKFLNRSKFGKYEHIVNQETKKYKRVLFEKWDGFCYYSKKKLITNEQFRRKFPRKSLNKNKLQPTIDHKTSILSGFKKKINPKIIGNIKNLCICAKVINIIKREKDEFLFKNMYKNL